MKESRPRFPRQLKTSIPLYISYSILTILFFLLAWEQLIPLYVAIILYLAASVLFVYIFSRNWESEMLHPHFEKYFPSIKSVLSLNSAELLFVTGQRGPVNIQEFVKDSNHCCLIAVQYFLHDTNLLNASLRTNYMNLLHTSFEQLLRPKLAKLGDLLAFTIQDTQYILINLDMKNINLPILEDNTPNDTICAALNENICRTIAPLRNEFEKSHNVDVLCAIGAINLENIGFFWVSSSTQDMLQYALMCGATSGLYSFYKHQRLFTQEEKNQRLNLERKYYNHILNNNYSGAYDILCQIINLENTGPLDMLRNIRDRIMNKVEAAIIFRGFGPESCYCGISENAAMHDLYVQMSTAKTFTELKSMLKTLFDLLDAHDFSTQSYPANIVTAAMEYIQKHYTDPNLNIAEVCDALDTKPTSAWLSKEFKKQVGISPSNYITEQRIRRAKQLLMSDEYTIENIAQQVGYTSRLTFYRAFKKSEGLTPGEMRNILNQ